MAKFKGFGHSPKPQLTQSVPSPTSAASPLLDLEIQVELWNAGLLQLELPQGMQHRALTPAEIEWLDQVAQTEYLDPEERGLCAIFYRTTSNAHLIYGWDVTLCGFSRSQSFP